MIESWTSCVQYIVGSSDLVCTNVLTDYDTLDLTCVIIINGQQCSSCSPVTCTTGGESMPFKLDSALLVSYDFSSIDGMHSYDPCTNATQPPVLDVFRNEDDSFMSTQSCYNASNIKIPPYSFPTSGSADPSSTNIASNITIPLYSFPTSGSADPSSAKWLGLESSYCSILAVIT
jgi:hypothetical protein